jgi:hypothetical protein
MPDPTAFLPGLGVALVAVVLLWFAIGTQRNISRGNQLLRWLQDGLGVLGPRTTLRWLGSSVAELRIVGPLAPFREALVMVVLEPRDLGALWSLARSRGRRDFLLLRLSMVRAPRFAADLVDPIAWTAGDRRRDEPELEGRQTWTDAAGRILELRHGPQVDSGAMRRHWDRLAASAPPWRLSVRQTVPHLEIHLLPPDTTKAGGSRRLFDSVREIALAVSGE